MAYNPLMSEKLVTVVETNAFIAQAASIVTLDERSEIIDTIATNSTCGTLIPGTGGA